MPADPPKYGTLLHPTADGVAPPLDRTDYPPPAGFELREEVGRGGMGVVFRARDVALDRDVAVKVLRSDYQPDGVSGRRFVAEARITARLQHPGIPPVYHVGHLPDGRPFLAMKLIQGRTLDALLAARTERDQLVGAFEGVCQAVGYAHSKGVIHRDLKPANIMVGAFGEVQVMDWGLAKELSAVSREAESSEPSADLPPTGTARPDETRAGSVMGTPAFMAPEQASGAIDRMDARTDVFGLGAVLCNLLTGQPPFVGEDVLSTHQMAVRGQVSAAFARLDGCGADPPLIALCKRCLAADRLERPAHGGEVAAAVAELRAAAAARAHRAEVTAAELRVRRRLTVIAAAAVVTVLAGGLAAAGWQAIRATAAEQATADQLALTVKAEGQAREEAERAKAAERVAREAGEAARVEEAKAKAAERVAVTERERAKAEEQKAVASAEKARQEEQKAITAADLARVREGEARDAAAETKAFSDFLTGNILAASRPVGQPGGVGRDAKLSDALRAAEKALDATFAGRPKAEAAARQALGVTWRNLGDFDRAAAHLTRAVELRAKEHGDAHPDTLTSLSSLGGLHLARKNFDEAERLYRRVLDGRRAALPPGDPATLTSIHNLAELLRSREKLADAEPLFREALAGRRAKLGDAHADTLASVYSLGTVLQAQKRPAEAESLYREVLAVARGSGELPLVAVHCVHNLAVLADDEGLFREALAGYRKAIGDTHPDTANAAFNLGRLLLRKGDAGAAEPLLREAFAGRRTAFGDANPLTRTAGRELAAVLVDRRRFAEALTLLEADPPAPPHLLGLAKLGAGKLAAAEPLLLEAARNPPDRHWQRRVYAGLAKLYTAAGRPAEAARWRAALPPEVAPPPRTALGS